jgi:hypothetical protein
VLEFSSSVFTSTVIMRLINTTTLELQDFSLLPIPPYVILSHTWGDGEVSFQEMSLPSRFSMNGFEKIAKNLSAGARARPWIRVG